MAPARLWRATRHLTEHVRRSARDHDGSGWPQLVHELRFIGRPPAWTSTHRFDGCLSYRRPLAGLTQFTYDGNGNLLTLTDARSGVTTYTYDSMDRVATRKDPLLKTASYVYDANANLTKVTDRLGLVTTYQYDALNRQTFAGFKTQGTAPNFTYESTIGYTYDAGNRLRTAVDSGAGTITLGYDDLDRMTSESSPQGSTSVGFDTAGRRTSMTLTGQPQVTYGYDNANYLTSITQGIAAVGFTYDDAGRMLTATLPNSVVGTYTYDVASHVTGISYAQGQTMVGDLTYGYDAGGHRATAGGSLARVTLPAAVGTTTYNADNQLTKWANNQTKPTYDANGNMLTDGTYTYVWSARNRLTQLKQGTTVVGTFAYDALGRRISKILSGTTTGFAYDAGNFVQEKNGSGTPTANLLTGGTDQTFSRTDGTSTRYLLTDALGSTVGLVDTAGTIQTSYTYEPFGKTTVTGAANGNAQQFTGRENDGSLYYYRARYYNPTFGRFISEDPAGFDGSGPNQYIYAGNDPVGLTDPTGQNPFAFACAAGAIGGFFGDLIGSALGHRKTSFLELVGAAGAGCAGGVAIMAAFVFGPAAIASVGGGLAALKDRIQAGVVRPPALQGPGVGYVVDTHAIDRILLRAGGDPSLVARVIDTGQKFQYWHEGLWKTGFFDPGSRLFVGTYGNEVLTVIDNATDRYIRSLQMAHP